METPHTIVTGSNQPAPGETGVPGRFAAGASPAGTGNRHLPDGHRELHRDESRHGKNGALMSPNGIGVIPLYQGLNGLLHA
jgi:hypothetical protein